MDDHSANQPRISVLEPGYASYQTEASILARHGATLVPVAEEDDAVEALKAIDPVAILVRERLVGQAELSACPNLKIVQRYGVGVDNIDCAEATRRGIFVANVPTYGAEHEVSDHALGLYLALQRRIVTRDAEVRSGQWDIGQAQPIMGRGASTLGLIGYGRIGAQARKKFAVFGFSRVLVSDPSLTQSAAREDGVEVSDVDTICSEADVISLHAPLTSITHHIIDQRRIALMKPTTLVINVSRGGLIDETALADALSSGALSGAGLDVFETEPPALDHPLRLTPNTILTDHSAWYSERSARALQETAAQQIAKVMDGNPPDHWVNRWPS
ncbi:MAG: C-terminal binding protein [Rhizobiales bacterium]|nr:C-terminal binding protein [Hyphomicrobiales bacterium]MBO6697910.1 C-terminal binding protein [Hyphomicrobiales bacterium]MBO6735836.1 C-terminal binding protein [Hyphomicrobiales bacterium]MBO6913847.1 C-terminal binding protein [Hyphomicrobiales bacterium]MBO6955550.1 C-terminal binding protein [Hyphomicrobiales bacterium]